MKDALVAAVVRLLERRSAADLSVREIADEARVNHGLVHRHFGSKEALLREAVVRTHALVHRDRPTEDETAWFVALLARRPEIARILARCCLDGPRDLLRLAAPPAADLERDVASIAAAVERHGLAGTIDPHVVNAVGCAALLGWTVFRPLFDAGFRLPPDADEQIARLAAFLDRTLRPPPG